MCVPLRLHAQKCMPKSRLPKTGALNGAGSPLRIVTRRGSSVLQEVLRGANSLPRIAELTERTHSTRLRMPPATAPPHQLGCNTAYFYYCTNASDVLSVAAEGGKAAAVRFWLEKMETNLDMPSRNQGSMRVDLTPLGGPFDATIRQAIAFHARVVERFVNQSSLFPPSIVPPRTPVLYPFSGMDVLTATHFFPHASSYTLLANLELGKRAVDPLDCFADYECVRMASRSAYKVRDCDSTCVQRDHGNCARFN
jgi:hypothetical protein